MQQLSDAHSGERFPFWALCVHQFRDLVRRKALVGKLDHARLAFDAPPGATSWMTAAIYTRTRAEPAFRSPTRHWEPLATGEATRFARRAVANSGAVNRTEFPAASSQCAGVHADRAMADLAADTVLGSAG